MLIFLLIYTHIAAVVFGVVLLDWWTTRKSFWIDVWALFFIVVLWPLAVWLLIQKKAGRP